RNRHPEWRATHVVQPKFMTEFDGRRVAAVLAADSDFQLCIGRPPLLDTNAHELADAFAVERLKWVHWPDAFLDVAQQELGLGIVPREAAHRLRQVVCAERKEVCFGCD